MNRFEADLLGQVQSRGDEVRDVRVLVACSGGGDSVALLASLWALRNSLGLDLVVAHVDHALRPEAAEDAAFVRDLARRLDLDLVEARLDVKLRAEAAGEGIETAARELRWAWLKAEAASCGATAVATGHTLDDHTETVLLRLARGGGLGSLTPLAPRQGVRWSPLVQRRRAELRDYLRDRGLPWREDPTNDEPFTPRNRLRRLLPALRAEAPGLDAHLFETHRQVAEARTLAEALVRSWEGHRWRTDRTDKGVFLDKGPWTEPELRFVLEAGFRDLGWPREADFLRDVATWLLGRIHRRPGRDRWGHLVLEIELTEVRLHSTQGAHPSDG